MENEKISTTDTKKLTGLDDSGIRKIRKIFQQKKRLGCRELFSKEQVDEIREIVEYQRQHPHSSYMTAYDAITMKNALDLIITEEADDFTTLAILTMGEKELDRFFGLFNQLTDLVAAYDNESAQILKNLQSLILAKICLQAQNSKKTEVVQN